MVETVLSAYYKEIHLRGYLNWLKLRSHRAFEQTEIGLRKLPRYIENCTGSDQTMQTEQEINSLSKQKQTFSTAHLSQGLNILYIRLSECACADLAMCCVQKTVIKTNCESADRAVHIPLELRMR